MRGRNDFVGGLCNANIPLKEIYMNVEILLDDVEQVDKIKLGLINDARIVDYLPHINIELTDKREGFLGEMPAMLTIVFDLGIGLSTGLLASWIYDNAKGRCEKVRVQRREIEFTKGQLTKVIEEVYEKE